jgi:hypothetical protein
LPDYAVGDVVECVDDRPSRPESLIMPELGALYTVATLRAVGDGHSVRLEEMRPSCRLGGVCACGDCGWDSGRFRRVGRPDPAVLEELLRLLEPALSAG